MPHTRAIQLAQRQPGSVQRQTSKHDSMPPPPCPSGKWEVLPVYALPEGVRFTHVCDQYAPTSSDAALPTLSSYAVTACLESLLQGTEYSHRGRVAHALL